jgi:hypothetical protein
VPAVAMVAAGPRLGTPRHTANRVATVLTRRGTSTPAPRIGDLTVAHARRGIRVGIFWAHGNNSVGPRELGHHAR